MQKLAIASLASLLVGCGVDADVTTEGLVLDPPPAAVDFSRSMIVTDHATLDQLYPDFHVGRLLEAENEYIQNLGGYNVHTDQAFALAAFQGGANDIDNHNNYGGLKFGTVGKIVNSFSGQILPTYNPDTGAEPFHLIAVVNRQDLAGDYDMRTGGILAANQRHWFGEGRLVYALTSTLNGKPYPLTVILEYRLPALKKNKDGSIVLDPTFDFSQGPGTDAVWATQRQLWAQVWQDLSTQPLGSAAYLAKLREIVSWYAWGSTYANRGKNVLAPQNHLAIRTGERVQDATTNKLTGEFEYREFYLDANANFATRKLRRETFQCGNLAGTFRDRIDSEWVSANDDLAWNYMLGPRELKQKEYDDLASTCDPASPQLPYGQADDIDGSGSEFRAKFTRFTKSMVWQQGSIATEDEIHAYAAGTCSGCHGSETGGTGFQIAPPAIGSDAQLSAFLLGQTQASPRGVLHVVDEHQRRLDLMKAFLAGKSPSDDSLLQDVACNDSSNPQLCPIPGGD